MKIATSHPAKQVVVYEIVKQLLAQGCLAAHLASVYYDPGRLRYGVWRHLPGPLGKRIDLELRKRCSPGLPSRVVRDAPWVEVVLAVLSKIPWLGRFLGHRRAYRLTDWFHDRRAARWVRRQKGLDVVVAFQGSALNTLKAAKAVKATAVLMAMHPLDHHRIVAAEYARFGRHVPSETPERLLHELSVADYIVSASRATTKALQASGVPPGKIKELPYGIDACLPKYSGPRVGSNRVVRFLFVGKLSLHKGLHVLRDAFQAIPAANVSLTIVGRPVSDLETQLLGTWQDPRVRIVDEVPDIIDAYLSADVFVFPSLVEGFGMVTLEAMAAGLPVIVTNRCSTVVRDGVDGYVVAAGSSDELRARMVRLTESPAERITLGHNARQRAREFTWERFGTALTDWLAEVTAKDRCQSARA